MVYLLFKVFFTYFIFRPSEDIKSYRNNNFNVFGLEIPRNLEFCGEKIPTNDYALKDNLDKEFFNNKYWKSSYPLLLNKAQKWFPYIEPILKKEGVPDDFKYVAVIESHLSNAVSPAGAVGFWQLVPATARHYGLTVDEYIDERLDVEKSTYVACKLFKDAHREFNNWTLAAAAYNLGIGGIQNALKKQGSDSYYDLLLNRETASFVYRILAYKTLFSSPEHFGLKQKSFKYFGKVPLRTVKIDSSITNLGHFAKTLNTNVAVIKLFNPWLLQDVLPNPERKVIEFRLPLKNTDDYSGYFDDLMGKHSFGTDSVIAPNLSDTLAAEEIITHIVNGKESLKEISEFYSVNEDELRQWNSITDTSIIAAGKKLIVKINKRSKK